MNAPHDPPSVRISVDGPTCKRPDRHEPKLVCGYPRPPSAAACPHAAEGFLFKLDPQAHAGATGLEWCPGCGAHRLLGPGRAARNMREPGPWVVPLGSRDRR